MVSANLHTCAVSYGKVGCWGKNSEGQTDVPHHGRGQGKGGGQRVHQGSEAGGGEADARETRHAVTVRTGNTHTCSLDSSHEVRCWGNTD
mmetsp:Transcript_33679/g.28442  ORF Transcript_33679/g.28442 Transcript_33679/m.28442 type:complete len:90 (-) Transcript_33679:196-465(-)